MTQRHFPGRLTVTTSWDDGHPSDIRLATLLQKHGVQGTFYVPTRNAERRPVLTGRQIAELAQHYEIGGHTRDHLPLTSLPGATAYLQILSNKMYLEDILGRSVAGFAYVRGANNRLTRNLVKRAGYRYARGIRSLTSHLALQPFAMPVTAQFYPHQRLTYLKNYISGGPSLPRTRLLYSAVSGQRLSSRCVALAEACARSGRHFHLWGHSWELEDHNLWNELDDFFHRLSDLQPNYVTNVALAPLSADENINYRRRAIDVAGVECVGDLPIAAPPMGGAS